MADSPLLNSDGVVTLRLKSDGTQVPDTVQIISVHVTREINRIPTATLVLLDGDMPTGAFEVADSANFKPGAEIEVEAGYQSEFKTLFKGIVVKSGIGISGNNYSRLTVECKDKAVGMSIGRKSENYVDMTDSGIMSKLIGNHGGLTADVASTSYQYKELVQYHTSDWDYLLLRAEANGLLVSVLDGKVSAQAPKTSASPVLTVTYGIDLIEFHADLDAQTQLTSVQTVAWDQAQQAIVEQSASPQTLNAQGDLDSAALAQVSGPSVYSLRSAARLDSSVLEAWGKAAQVRSGLSRIRGSMRFQGSALPVLNGLIEIKGVGARFGGNVFVSGIRHEIENGDWITEVDFGLSARTLNETVDVAPPLAAGLTGSISGLQIGVVKKLDADPEGEHKVQVSLPVLQSQTDGVWVRLSNFYSSSGFGAFFIPEIGDEVILGFLDNDPSHPVILGSVYSSKRQPPTPYSLTADNFFKAIVTRSMLRVEFDDDKKVITVITPAKNKIVLSDDEKSILMLDQNNNKVLLDPGGITIDTPKDIKITAKGQITVDAVGNISSSSKADISEQALNIKNEGSIGFSAKGGATAELQASGQTTVKGAMVMIN